MPTKIPWVINPDGTPGETWNPVIGCSPVSEECYRDPFHVVRCFPERLDIPLKRKKPTTYFVASMGDLFHEDVPCEFIIRVWNVMSRCPQHRFIVLTKRAKRMKDFINRISHEDWKFFLDYPLGHHAPLKNLILGVSVSTQADADKFIPLLLDTPAACHVVSYEPALELVDFKKWMPLLECDECGGWGVIEPDPTHRPNDTVRCNYCKGDGYFENEDNSINWLIMGAESGKNRRHFNENWAHNTKYDCENGGVPFFYKQGIQNGKLVHVPFLDGKQWTQIPEVIK